MYGLTWTVDAIDALADIYLAATVAERERMSPGVEALNARLRTNPGVEVSRGTTASA